MRSVILLLLFLGLSHYLAAQIVPEQNDSSKITELGIKTVSTHYKSGEAGENYLIFKKEFDASGTLVSKMQLSLWDVVSYRYTYTYQYDEAGRLQEELIMQEILQIYERDKDFIKTFGDTPLNKKILYEYNDDNLLSRKTIFTFAQNAPAENATPDQTVTYAYENGVLISEKSVSADEKFFNKNYQVEYKYDSVGNLVQKSRNFGKENGMHQKTFYRYDEQNLLIEEQTIDTSIPHNNLHLKYDYYDDGKVRNKYVFEDETQEFELETTYTYDESGNAISGDREVQFAYDARGLIKEEIWTDPISDKLIQLETSYTFY
jgi:hypothetical protein